MTKYIVSSALAICLAGIGGMALAAGSEQKVGDFVVHMAADYNQDGKVTLEEHRAFAQAAFAQMDLNGDGYLDQMEIMQYQMKRLEYARKAKATPDDKLADPAQAMPIFKLPPGLDKDEDGKVSLAEHLDYETKVFKANANADGVITAKEILAKDREVQEEIARKLRLLREQNQASNQQQKPATFSYQSTK